MPVVPASTANSASMRAGYSQGGTVTDRRPATGGVRRMRIGILTGGGDVPGLNACIKAVVNRVVAGRHTVVGIRRGWGGLLGFDPDDPTSTAGLLEPLEPASVRTIDRTGGTILHTSRTNPARVQREDVPPFLEADAA